MQQITWPERHRLFQTVTVVFTAFGSAVGGAYSSELSGGVAGGVMGLIIGFVFMRLLIKDIKHIVRRNIVERTVDSAISMLGAGIFSGVLGVLFGYFLERDFSLAFSMSLTSATAGVISTSMAGLAVFFWENYGK